MRFKRKLWSTVIPRNFTIFSLQKRLPLTLICKPLSVVNITRVIIAAICLKTVIMKPVKKFRRFRI